MNEVFGQASHQVRMDWGPAGTLACRAGAMAVVDVLSFSTTVTVAAERGTRVYPWPSGEDGARGLASAQDAVLAVGRSDPRAVAGLAVSLSPASVLTADRVERLVLPSPNGSAIAAAAQQDGGRVAVGCLRNAGAAARWLADRLADGVDVAVIAAGERWGHDASLRPAVEDALGAGAILSALSRLEHGAAFSPEAWVAASTYDAVADRVPALLRDCVSGQELTVRGFGHDIAIAAEIDVTSVVAVMDDGAFAPADVTAGWARSARWGSD